MASEAAAEELAVEVSKAAPEARMMAASAKASRETERPELMQTGYTSPNRKRNSIAMMRPAWRL